MLNILVFEIDTEKTVHQQFIAEVIHRKQVTVTLSSQNKQKIKQFLIFFGELFAVFLISAVSWLAMSCTFVNYLCGELFAVTLLCGTFLHFLW
jgi:hypothetical protein